MNLLCIFDVEKSEALMAEYKEIYSNLKERYGHGEYKMFDRYNELFEDYMANPQYARTIHTGKIKDRIKLTELELSMVCDGGFSHFGGYSTICSDGTFRVEIFTD